MSITRAGALSTLLALALGLALLLPPPRIRAQGAADVWLNVQKGGATRLNLAVPSFTVTSGADPGGLGKTLADVTGQDLTFTGLFSVVAGTAPLPESEPEAFRRSLGEFAQAGAHAAVHGRLALRSDRAEAEMRLWDLTGTEPRMVASKTFAVSTPHARRLAHKIADEVMLQFTGERGSADTKIAFVRGRARTKEVHVVDYDGYAPTRVTENGSINLTPVWSPDARSIAFTSYMKGYPDLYRAFPFERRPVQAVAAFVGINASPAFSPDGKSLALTASRDGNAEIYVLNFATGSYRRLTRHLGIDAEPTWSPTGRQIAFTSDRRGQPAIFVMDDEGANVRPLTSGGFHTQPRWSPRGDLIAYTVRRGTHSIWLVNADGSNPRPLESGPGDAESPSWSPDGRHLAFQSNRTGIWQIYTTGLDGAEIRVVASSDATSPSWSPRLP
jgi:TolB protein